VDEIERITRKTLRNLDWCSDKESVIRVRFWKRFRKFFDQLYVKIALLIKIMPVYSESLIFLHAIRCKKKQSWDCKECLFGKNSLTNTPKKKELLKNINPVILLSFQFYLPLAIEW